MYTLTLENGKEISATEEQVEIIEYALANPDCLQVIALAGTAKTTTLRFLAKYCTPIPTLSVAFNRRIVDELKRVLPTNVQPSTVNSVGHRAWGGQIGKKLLLDTRKNGEIIKHIMEPMKRQQQAEVWDNFGDLVKVMSKAKLAGYVPKESIASKSLLTEDEFFDDLEEAYDDWFKGLVNKALAESIKRAFGGLIDFDDQIYMPTLFGGVFPSFPRIFVDEAQDLSAINHAMLDRLMRPGTQLIAVGDPWQSIYAFRGAVTASMSRLKERYSMHELGLSVSFRCPIEVIKKAHDRVPHMKWPEWAIQGKVERLANWSGNSIPDGAAIICRNNAPLLSCALALLKEGRGVHLVGTDLGPQLIKALKKFGDLSMTQEHVFQAISEWEKERLKKGRNEAVIADKAECLRVFAGFGPTLGAAVAYAEHIFSAKGPIQLMSGHKSKGLEFDTVYHLDPKRIPSPWAKEGEALEQELNVRYVIETRPKKELYLVEMEGLDAEV